MTVNMKIHRFGVRCARRNSVMISTCRQDQNVSAVHFEDLIFKTNLPFAIYHIDKIVNDHISCGVHTWFIKKAKVGGFYDSDEWRDAFLSATLKAIIIDIARSAADTAHSRKRSPLVEDVIRYMREHYSERVENETLSKHFHFTSVYINRLFKQETGISLHKYLIALRVDVAKELIASGEYSPSEAAIATGFEDYPHFSKTFKALTGKSPTDYREAFTLKTNQ